MFDNVGAKLKKMAKIFCWIGIIAFVLIGFIMIVSAENQYGSAVGTMRLTGACYLIVGPLCSWLSTLGLYALGQIAEDVENMKWTMEANKNNDD